MNATMAIRRPRRSLVVLASITQQDEGPARALAESLSELGIEASYLGREDDAQRIAAAVIDGYADAVELCMAGHCGVLLLRELLRTLVALGRREVSIVVHRLG